MYLHFGAHHCTGSKTIIFCVELWCVYTCWQKVIRRVRSKFAAQCVYAVNAKYIILYIILCHSTTSCSLVDGGEELGRDHDDACSTKLTQAHQLPQTSSAPFHVSYPYRDTVRARQRFRLVQVHRITIMTNNRLITAKHVTPQQTRLITLSV